MTPDRRMNFVSWINVLLAGIMVSCLAVAGSRIQEAMAAASGSALSDPPFLLIAGSFLVAVEVQLTRRLLPNHPLFTREWARAMLIEWVCLLLGMVSVLWISRGWEFILGEIRAMPGDVLAVFQKQEYLDALMVLILSWGASRILVPELVALEEEPVPSPKEQIVDPLGDQMRARDRLWEHAFIFGACIILFSLIVPSILRSFQENPIPPRTLGLEVPVYFLSALVLLTVGRFLLLRADWTWERTPILPGLARRWIAYSMVFLLLAVVLASILPTAYSFDMLASLDRAIMGFVQAGMLLWMLLFTYIILPLITLLSRLFSGASGSAAAPAGLDNDKLRMLESLNFGGGWIAVLREMLLWTLIASLLFYVGRELLRNRWTLLRGLLRWKVGRWLLKIWHEIWKRLARLPKRAVQAVRASLRGMMMEWTDRTSRLDFGRIRLGNLSDPARVRFYFFALIRRGTEQGYPRDPAQTPREYTNGLAGAYPLLQPEISEMTLAFEEARYTQHAIGRRESRRIRKVWDTIRPQLRKPKRSNTPDGIKQA